MKIVYFDAKTRPPTEQCLACVRKKSCRRVTGYANAGYEAWDGVIYIFEDLGRIGKAMTFFHELFHYVLNWIEWRKQRRIFPEGLKVAWENLWALQFMKVLQNLKEVLVR